MQLPVAAEEGVSMQGEILVLTTTNFDLLEP